MRKLDLILENIRDEFMINLLEEGETSELGTLKTKKFLNENLGRIRKMLVEEGALDSVKNHLANNWGKYLAGAGAAGAGALAYEYSPQIMEYLAGKGIGSDEDVQRAQTMQAIANKADASIQTGGLTGINTGMKPTQTPLQQLEAEGRAGMSGDAYVSKEAQALRDAEEESLRKAALSAASSDKMPGITQAGSDYLNNLLKTPRS